jgi:hypothetical protein
MAAELNLWLRGPVVLEDWDLGPSAYEPDNRVTT